ncbi:MAG: class I SAM-dependent methyltransferase [Kurthia sp.]|nr:class I SAM-dependent methyltransferase [Candidatus Kurthia equi]
MCRLKTITTTGGRPDALSLEKARFVAQQLTIECIPRKKRSVQKLAEAYQAHIIVAGKGRYEYFPYGAVEPFFFHPSSAAFRIKRLVRGELDTFIQSANLQAGDSLLDCTLGLATDSMIAAEVVGDTGRVVGCEANANVAFIVKQGLKEYDFEAENLPQLSRMRNIEVVSENAVDYLKKQPDNSFDVVYLDPMFEEVIEESKNFKPLRQAGVHDEVSNEWIEQAKRVAKKRVVLKAHFRSPLFARFQFEQQVRPNIKFHFGVIHCEEKECL